MIDCSPHQMTIDHFALSHTFLNRPWKPQMVNSTSDVGSYRRVAHNRRYTCIDTYRVTLSSLKQKAAPLFNGRVAAP